MRWSSSSNIYPTLCDLAGLDKPKHLQGDSAAVFLDDAQAPSKPAALSQYPRGRVMGYSLRTDRYRLTVWKNRKQGSVEAIELYDHQQDPAENVNVAELPENEGLVRAVTGATYGPVRAFRQVRTRPEIGYRIYRPSPYPLPRYSRSAGRWRGNGNR